MAKERTPLKHLIEDYRLNQLLGPALQELSERILKLPLKEDEHAIHLAKIYSLLNNFPSEDDSISRMIEEMLTACRPPYLLEEVDKANTTLQIAAFINLCMARLSRSNWSMRFTAHQYLRELRDFYLAASEMETNEEYRVSVAILGAAKYYHTDLKTARDILCIDPQGRVVKKNKTGMRAVQLDEETGVVYKPNPLKREGQALSAIQPGMEYAVFALLQLTAGQMIAAPTHLLSVYGVPVVSSPRDGFEESKLVGESIQAGLLIKGICFRKFLELRTTLKVWKERLSENMEDILHDAADNFAQIHREVQERYPQIFAAAEDKEQSKILLNIINSLSTEDTHNLTDIQNIKARSEGNRQGTFDKMLRTYYQDYGGDKEDVFICIHFISKFLRLMHNRSMMELLFDIKNIRSLFKSLRKESALDVCHKIEEILTQYLDGEAMSALFIASLLALFGDGKADNFILKWIFNEAGQLVSCYLVSIDNDNSLQMPISRETLKRGLFLTALAAEQSLESRILENARKQNIPILIKKGENFSIYGYQNGQWQETDLNLAILQEDERGVFKKLDFKIAWIESRAIPEVLFRLLRRGHTLRLCLEIKNILFAIPELMRRTLHPNIKKRLLAISTEHQWLNWLCILACRDSDYAYLSMHRKQHNKLDMPIELSQQVINFVVEQWRKLKILVTLNEGEITHEDCLKALLPGVWATYQSLQEKYPAPLEFEFMLYRLFDNACFLDEQIGVEKFYEVGLNGQSLFDTAEAQCASTEVKFIKPAEFCLSQLRQLDWAALSLAEAWEYVQVFSLLPQHLATVEIWAGGMEREDIRTLFQFWFEMAVFLGSPLVAQRMLYLGADLNSAESNTQKTALHQFCERCLYYADYETAKLMAELLFTHPSCQLDQYSMEGTPLIALITWAPELHMLNEMQKKIMRYILDYFIRLGVDLEARNIKHKTVVDVAFSKMANRKRTDSKIETWFVELVRLGAGRHANGEAIYGFYKTVDVLEIIGFEEAIEILKERNLSLCWHFQLEPLKQPPIHQKWQRVDSKQLKHRVKPFLMGTKAAAMDSTEDAETIDLLPTVSTAGIAVDCEQSIVKGILCTPNEDHNIVYVQEGSEWHLRRGLSVQVAAMKTASDLFCQLLFGDLTVPSRFIAVTDKREGVIPIELSKTITGENLQKILMQLKHAAVEIDSIKACSSRSYSFSAASFGSTDLEDVKLPQNSSQAFNLSRLDEKELSAQIIMAILTNPKQGYPENYHIVPVSNGKGQITYRLIRLSYEGAFSECLVEEDNPKTNSACILFCFNYMLKPVHPAVRGWLRFIIAEALLKEWLRELMAYHHWFVRRFPLKPNHSSLKSSLFSKMVSQSSSFNLTSGIYFTFEFIDGLLERIQKIQDLLRIDASISHLQLLTKIWPSLGEHYRNVLMVYPEPEKIMVRFEEVIGFSSDSRKMSGRWNKALGIVSERGSIRECHKTLDPEQAKNELVHENIGRGKIQNCLERLHRGQVVDLDSIQSQRRLERLFNQFFSNEVEMDTKSEKGNRMECYLIDEYQSIDPFRLMEINKKLNELFGIFFNKKERRLEPTGKSTAEEESCKDVSVKVLEAFIKKEIDFEELNIQNCLLNNSDLEKLLSKSKKLRKLCIINCPNLANGMMVFIHKKSECLETLILQNLPGLTSVSLGTLDRGIIIPLKFPRLKKCIIAHNSALKKIFIMAPKLSFMNVSYNTQLANIKLLDSKRLRCCNISHCPVLTDRVLIKILEPCTTLPYVQMTSCVGIQSSLIHHISLFCTELFAQLTIEDFKEQIERLNIWMLESKVTVSLNRQFKNVDLAIEMISILLKKHSNLKTLIIDSGLILDQSAQDRLIIAIFDGMNTNKTLIHLDIKAIVLSEVQWDLLQEMLQKNDSLQEVDITLDELQELKNREQTLTRKIRPVFTEFASYLQCHKHISLKINQVDFAEKGRVFLKARGESVNVMWDLSARSEFTQMDMQAVSSLLTEDTQTLILILDGIPLIIENIITLFKSLEENTTLQLLSLCGCNLTDASIVHLMKLLLANTTLGFIHLDLNFISEQNHKMVLEKLIKRRVSIVDCINKYLRLLEYKGRVLEFHEQDANELLSWEKAAFALYSRGEKNIISWNAEVPIGGYDPSKPVSLQSQWYNLGEGEIFSAVQDIIFISRERIASAFSDGTIKIWDVCTKQCLYTLIGHSKSVNTLIFFENILVSGSEDNTIRVWSEHENSKGQYFYTNVGILEGHKGAVTKLIHNHNNHIISISKDGTLKIWNIEFLLCFIGNESCLIDTLCIADNCSITAQSMVERWDGTLVLGCDDGTLRIFDLAKKRCIGILTGHVGSILSLIQLFPTKSESYGNLVSNSKDATIVWKWNSIIQHYSSFYLLKEEFNPMLSLYPLFWEQAFIAGNHDGTVRIWWFDGTYHSKCSMIHLGSVTSVLQMPTGKLVSGFGDRKQDSAGMQGIRVWNGFFMQKSSFNISFVKEKECAQSVVLTQTGPLVCVALQDAQNIEILRQFLHHLFYNCYARNFLLYEMQRAIFIEENKMRIQCPNETLAFKLYNCLYALFFRQKRIEYFLNSIATHKAIAVNDVSSKPQSHLPPSSLYTSPFTFYRRPSLIGSPALLRRPSVSSTLTSSSSSIHSFH